MRQESRPMWPGRPRWAYADPGALMAKIPWGRETVAGLAGAIGSVPDGMATAVLAGANPMAGLYASFAGPAVGGLLQSTTVMVIATTSAAAVTTAEVMNEGPADPMRTLATLTVLAGLFMLLATRLGFARLMRFVSAYAHSSGTKDPRISGPRSPATGEANTARQRHD